MIKTIFFDIGGVLIDIHPEKTYQYISYCIDLSPDIIKKKFPWEAHNEYEKGHISDRDWYMAVKESLPQPCCLKESDFWKGWKQLLGKEKKTLAILQKLKLKHNIWLLSNTNSKHIQDEIEINYLFPKSVNGAIYSFEVGHRKPGEDIYKIALETAKVCTPKESLFVDDLYENIQAAKDLGMNAIHYQSNEQLKVEMNNVGLKL